MSEVASKRASVYQDGQRIHVPSSEKDSDHRHGRMEKSNGMGVRVVGESRQKEDPEQDRNTRGPEQTAREISQNRAPETAISIHADVGTFLQWHTPAPTGDEASLKA